jgi:hypothetical protein
MSTPGTPLDDYLNLSSVHKSISDVESEHGAVGCLSVVSDNWEVHSLSSLRSIALKSDDSTNAPTSSKATVQPKKPVILTKSHFMELWRLLHDIVDHNQCSPEVYDSVASIGINLLFYSINRSLNSSLGTRLLELGDMRGHRWSALEREDSVASVVSDSTQEPSTPVFI